MKLEPVYLLAPEPTAAPPPAPQPTRRAFLVGAALGCASGLAIGAAATRWLGWVFEAAAADEPDERTRWALTLQRGPIADFVADHETFLWLSESLRDPRLEPGIERLARAVIDGDDATRAVRSSLATSLAMTIEAFGPDHRLAELAPRLRAAARR